MPMSIQRGASAEEVAVAERLGRARLFRGLDPRALRPLLTGVRFRSLRVGESLWRAGECADHLAMIDRGAVTIAAPRRNGHAFVLGVFGADDCIGIPAVLARGAYPADASALVTETRVIWFSISAIHHAVESQPACARLIQTALLEHTAALRAKIEVLSAGSVAARTAAFLLYLAERFGLSRSDEEVEVPLAVPRVKLAQIIAARPETVIRTLAVWRRQRVVWSSADGFVIGSRSALQAIAERP